MSPWQAESLGNVLFSGFGARHSHLNLVIESPCPSQCRIETVGSICCRKHDDRVRVVGKV
jgi:hypothetical protein